MKLLEGVHPELPNSEGHSFGVYLDRGGTIYVCKKCCIKLSESLTKWKFDTDKNFRSQDMPKTCAEAKMIVALE